MFQGLKRQCGIDLPLSLLFEANTIREISQHLAQLNSSGFGMCYVTRNEKQSADSLTIGCSAGRWPSYVQQDAAINDLQTACGDAITQVQRWAADEIPLSCRHGGYAAGLFLVGDITNFDGLFYYF